MGEILKYKHNLLLDSIPAAFIVTDAHSKILFANERSQSFFGYEPEEMEGQRIGILFLEEDLIFFLPNILFLTSDKKGFSGESLLRRKDGKKIFVHLVTSSFTEDGNVFMAFAFQEIQRLKDLEQERAEVEHWARLGRMITGIAHQFRNPISCIGGYAHRLRKKVGASETAFSYIDRITGEIKRLESILGRVEEYARLIPSAFQRESIYGILESALKKAGEDARRQGVPIRLEAEPAAGGWEIFADRGRLVKAFIHLLQNSLDAVALNPASGRTKPIEVALSSEEETVTIVISDRGQGITKKDLGMIFEPFFSTRPDRAGLGLTFVRRVVEEHGGKIRVESRPRQGTAITVEIPKDRRRKIRRALLSPFAASGAAESPAGAAIIAS